MKFLFKLFVNSVLIYFSVILYNYAISGDSLIKQEYESSINIGMIVVSIFCVLAGAILTMSSIGYKRNQLSYGQSIQVERTIIQSFCYFVMSLIVIGMMYLVKTEMMYDLSIFISSALFVIPILNLVSPIKLKRMVQA